MKKVLLAGMLFALSYGQIVAQKIKGKDEEVSKIKEIPGVITQIPKDQKFKMVLGGKLNYLNPKDFYVPNWLGGMNAKIERSADKPTDYTFEFVTDGMTLVECSDLKPSTDAGIKGDVVEVKYTMPRRIVIKDNAGTVLQTWTIDTDEKVKTAIVYPGFTNPQASPMNGAAAVVNGYIINDKYTKENFERDFEQSKPKIFSRIEYNALNNLTSDNNLRYLENAYSRIKTDSPKVMVLDKKSKADNPELDAKIDALIALVNKIYEGGFDQEVRKEGVALGDYFASQYTTDSEKELQKICGFNAALSYGIGNDITKSYKQYKNIENLFGLFGGPTGGLSTNVGRYMTLNKLYDAKQNGIMEIGPSLSYENFKRQELDSQNEAKKAAIAEALKYNLRNAEGFIIDKNGEKVEGIVRELTLVETGSGNIANLSLGKVFEFGYANGKGKYLKLGDVQSISAGGFYYEPIKEKESTGMKILSTALTGKTSGASFMPMVYQKDVYKVFYTPEFDYYLIKKDGDEFAYSMSTLTGKGKDAKEFIGDCDALNSKVEAKEVARGKDGAIMFVNMLVDCKK